MEDKKIRIVCNCGNCQNTLVINKTDENAELLIYENTEHKGRRVGIIVPLELAVAIENAARREGVTWQTFTKSTLTTPPLVM